MIEILSCPSCRCAGEPAVLLTRCCRSRRCDVARSRRSGTTTRRGTRSRCATSGTTVCVNEPQSVATPATNDGAAGFEMSMIRMPSKPRRDDWWTAGWPCGSRRRLPACPCCRTLERLRPVDRAERRWSRNSRLPQIRRRQMHRCTRSRSGARGWPDSRCRRSGGRGCRPERACCPRTPGRCCAARCEACRASPGARRGGRLVRVNRRIRTARRTALSRDGREYVGGGAVSGRLRRDGQRLHGRERSLAAASSPRRMSSVACRRGLRTKRRSPRSIVTASHRRIHAPRRRGRGCRIGVRRR